MRRYRDSATALYLVAGLAFVAPNARALDPHQPASSFLRTDFTIEAGASIINDLFQTRDGFLWVASPARLNRFDGRHFVPVDLLGNPGRQIAVRSIAEGPDGDLWVALDDDFGVFRIPRAALNQSGTLPSTVYHPGAPGRDWAAWSLCFTDDGTLWAGTLSGLYRFNGNGFTLVVPKLTVSHLVKMPNGHLLVVSAKAWREFDGVHEVRVETPPTNLVPVKQIFDVYPDREGNLWYCTDQGVFRRTGDAIEKVPFPRGQPAAPVFLAHQDRDGNVWVTTESAVFRAGPHELEPLALDLKARTLYSDRDGNLWVGTNGNGITRFKNRSVRMFTKDDGLPNNVVMAVLTDHSGKLWVANNCGGLSWFDGQRFHTYAEKDGLTNSCVYTMAEDASHDLWLGGGGGGLYRFHDGQFSNFSVGNGLPNNRVVSIIAARDGSVWVSTQSGLSHLHDGHFRTYRKADGLSHDVVNSLYEDRRGTIWAGTVDGLDRLEGDRFVPVLSSPSLRILTPTGEDEGAFYVAEELGLGRLENKQLAGFTDIEGIQLLRYEDDLWFAGNNIWRVPARSMRNWDPASGEPLDRIAYTRADGLIAPDSYGSPALTKTPDDKLWVATTRGLAMLDLPRMKRVVEKPYIYIGQIKVDRVGQPAAKELVLAPGIHHVEIAFDSIELTSPERTQLQYKLDGIDDRWVDAGSTHQAVYSSLPIGTRQLHIRASNRDGVWDRAGIIYNVTQQPFFYQTRSFQLAAFTSGCLLLMGFYRLRLRQAATRLNARLEDRLAERERIARELHDTLLQGFQGLTLHFQAALKQIPSGLPARDTMDKALQYADHVLKEGRERVRDLRAEGEESDLAKELLNFGEHMRDGAVEFHVTVAGDPRSLHPVVTDEIQQIAREALANAFRHSGASNIAAEINYGASSLGVRVRDNGGGIDAATLTGGRSGHWGLSGMKERAAKIGGQINIWSNSGTGTEIDLTIPAKVAYAEPAKGKRVGI